ncbi:hypothetical protein H8B02_14245 [Bradyrhizobium sp. Pear77]|uniref:hypothetical protein n=1 Tax=Bradyrhizobium TaxID=374 RepID=UPI001E64ECF7|nr:MULTISPECIES: hypothetical protein [Bradyrhizobium]MCC8954558.1 hypothetical protein [Bradyrhizobium altum]MCC8967826.1 hypothetical protein [Bradyrhizobium oropedii]
MSQIERLTPQDLILILNPDIWLADMIMHRSSTAALFLANDSEGPGNPEPRPYARSDRQRLRESARVHRFTHPNASPFVSRRAPPKPVWRTCCSRRPMSNGMVPLSRKSVTIGLTVESFNRGRLKEPRIISGASIAWQIGAAK